MSTLQPFTAQDYEAFAGVESETPMFAELDAGLLLVLDGPRVELFEDGETRCWETCCWRVCETAEEARVLAERLCSSADPVADAAHLDFERGPS